MMIAGFGGFGPIGRRPHRPLAPEHLIGLMVARRNKVPRPARSGQATSLHQELHQRFPIGRTNALVRCCKLNVSQGQLADVVGCIAHGHIRLATTSEHEDRRRQGTKCRDVADFDSCQRDTTAERHDSRSQIRHLANRTTHVD